MPSEDTDRPAGPRPDGPATSLTLLQRVRDKDQGAWRRLTELYTPLVYYWCGRGGVRGAAADDLVQEVFLAAFTSLGQFRRDRAGDTFRGWLRGITRNHLLMHWRRHRGRPQAEGGTEARGRLEGVAEPSLPDEDDPPAQLRALYHRALELIRTDFEERTWQMFWLAVVEERPIDEVAARFGVTANGVRKSRARVLKRLRDEIGPLID
jgi:RNA polymerase sigma-70 factor (ECF subfamily)